MDEIIEDKMFLDWCHPLPEGQKLIAEKIMYIFNTNGVKGVNKSKLINKLYNPEYSMGNEMEFHKYYKSYSVSSEGDINEQIKKINIFLDNKIDYNSIDDKVNSISSDLKSSIEYYLKHPVITSINDILQYPPNNPVDIGRFPEYYIIKHIFPYLKIYENSNLSLPDIKLILLRSSDELISLLHKNNGLIVDSTELVIDENYESKRLPRIIAKVYKTLLSHLENGDQIYNRTKTSIYWYFRETLRFGSQSRISMRYDRITLEYISESLAVAYVLNNKLKSEY